MTDEWPTPATMPPQRGMTRDAHATHALLFDIDYSALETSIMRMMRPPCTHMIFDDLMEVSQGYLYAEAQPDIALCTDYEVLSSPSLTFRVSPETIRASS